VLLVTERSGSSCGPRGTGMIPTPDGVVDATLMSVCVLSIVSIVSVAVAASHGPIHDGSTQTFQALQVPGGLSR
jgi:hypothetical protein